MGSDDPEGVGSRVRRWLVRGVDELSARVWRATFAGLARVGHRRARRWDSAGGQRVLVVAPHPDDEIVGCGGTLLRHVQRHDRVSVVVVTDGRRSRALPLAEDEMAGVRRREAVAAAESLEASLIWLGLAEGEWRGDVLRRSLGTLIDELGPDLIYAPSRIDFHPEHRRVAYALANALDGSRHRPVVRVYQVQVPLTALLTNLVVEIEPVRSRLQAATDRYLSQRHIIRGARRLKGYAGAAYGRGGLVEEFWELPAGEFVRLHEAPALPQADGRAFRGLRPHAPSDPLAYWRGRRARRRLAAWAASAGDPKAQPR